ncbi:MAG: lysylphosphatidylglycerol synthase domain-containing protein [Acidimicrobiales bacterium]
MLKSHALGALLAISSVVAIVVAVSAVGSPSRVWTVLRTGDWAWVAIALVASLTTNVAYAVALKGTVKVTLPLLATTELEVAMTYSNVVVPLIGGTALQIRFLERQGVALPSAVTAGSVLSAAGAAISELPLFLIALVLSKNGIALGNLPVRRVLEVTGVVVVLLALAIVAAVELQHVQAKSLKPIKLGLATIVDTLRSPRQLALLLFGKAGASLLYGACLLACIQAFDADVSYWTALAVSIGVSSVAAVIPLPGGNTGAGTVGVTGVLVALGVHSQTALAVSIANQLAVNYIPAVPGWFATRDLLHKLV